MTDIVDVDYETAEMAARVWVHEGGSEETLSRAFLAQKQEIAALKQEYYALAERKKASEAELRQEIAALKALPTYTQAMRERMDYEDRKAELRAEIAMLKAKYNV